MAHASWCPGVASILLCPVRGNLSCREQCLWQQQLAWIGIARGLKGSGSAAAALRAGMRLAAAWMVAGPLDER